MCKLPKRQYFKILGVGSLLFVFANLAIDPYAWFEPAKRRPFRCSDKSIAQPYVEDTVTREQLYMLGIYFPIFLIVSCEFLTAWSITKSFKNWFAKFILKTIIMLSLFLTGLTMERFYKNVAKIKMGRLRPHFLAVCQPVTITGHNCFNITKYDVMYDYKCSKSDYPNWIVQSTFHSFPSGHTSLTAYGMVFLICYLYLLSFKRKRNFSCLLILIMQALCIITILFVAVSRILDFKHNFSDVGAGFIGGSCIALAINYYLYRQWENIENFLEQNISFGKEDADIVDVEIIEAGLNSNKLNEEEEKVYSMELV